MKPLAFLKIALGDYKRIGALVPTSRIAAQGMARTVALHARTVVEYGAGEGVITRTILKLLPQDGGLIAIESNPDLMERLKEIDDPRLTLMHGDVMTFMPKLHTLGAPRIDAIISGIPFSLLPQRTITHVMAHTARALAPEGRFVAYQTSLRLVPTLRALFPRVRWYWEPRNLFPYFVIIAEK